VGKELDAVVGAKIPKRHRGSEMNRIEATHREWIRPLRLSEDMLAHLDEGYPLKRAPYPEVNPRGKLRIDRTGGEESLDDPERLNPN